MNIYGYRLLGDLKNDNSGFAKWGFVEKNGLELFIKQFLSPVYPVDTSILSEEQIERKINICRQFEEQKRRFYDVLKTCNTGNVITIVDFFRYESKYYVVTEKVETKSISVEEIARLPLEKKLIIMKTILYSMSTLHSKGIVHADMKPDNILIKGTTKGFYTAKIIDFDSGFFELSPECSMNAEGDLVYFSPEMRIAMANDETNAANLSHKLDIFALGIIFHQYLTGKLPEIDKSEYDYIFEAVLDGGEVKIDPGIDRWIRELIEKMLSRDPAERPEAKEVFDVISNGGEKPRPPEPEPEPAFKSSLKINMNHKSAPAAPNVPFLKKAGDL